MSVGPTLITQEISEYILENFSSEDTFLADLKREASELDIPEIHISPEQGAFLQFFLKATGAKRVLEIGSLAGYSAITMARALPEGSELTAIEIEVEYAHFIIKKVKQAGLEHIIKVKNTDAKSYLKKAGSEEKYDFIFLDAEKRDYVEYFGLCRNLLKKGGVIAADNALAFGEIVTEFPVNSNREIEGVRNYNQFANNQPDFTSCLVPVGDGMLMSVKL